MSDDMKDVEVTELEALYEEEPSLDDPPDDTAEEIPIAEVSDSPIETTAPLEEPHIAFLVCEVCQELNLTQNAHIIECQRCGKAFCFHFASSINVDYCVNCMSDVSVEKSIITKTYEHRNDQTGQTTFYRRRARDIKIGGLDWLFAQRKIGDLTDTELDLVIEYHRNYYSLLLAENEKRRIEKAHRYAGVKIHLPKVGDANTTTTTTTTVKKSRTISKEKVKEQLAALMDAMLAKGMTQEQLKNLLIKK